jgi:RNA polymerase sigma-70 factor (ECF subfamily)
MKPATLRRTRDDLFPSGPGLAYVRLVDVPDQTTTTLNAEFLRHRAMIARYLRARGAGESAEDLIQELWMKVAAMPADADVADPASYLFRMAHNLMLDRHRAERRRADRDQHYHMVSDLTGSAHDPAPAPDRALIAKQRLAEVDHILTSLGPRTDYIFRRHRVEEVPQRDIAVELGITLSAVEKHLQKAYRAVRAVADSSVGRSVGEGVAHNRG